VIFLPTIFRLVRVETSFLGFLAIFIPLLVRNNDLSLSFWRAAPLLFISFCTFIANDLDDIEKDRINHPTRPLPAGHISPTIAVILYFTFLGSALFSTKYFIPSGIDFFYYGALSISISYGYIVEYIPALKTLYVAIGSAVPIFIVSCFYPNETRLNVAVGSIFLLTLGREIFKDIRDRVGDPVSFMHRFRPVPVAKTAFSLQIIGLLLLVTLIDRIGDLIDLLMMLILLVLSGFYWFKSKNYKLALIFMKIQLFVGLYFLI
jgi:geranylgeranylglycerol-phosphate geranylgeranyltransferase